MALRRAAAVASKIYIFCLSVFFAFAPQGGNLERIIPGLFFEGKKPPSKFGGIFVKESKCYFLKFFKGKKPPNKLGGFLKNKSWGVSPLSWGEK